MVDDTLRDDYDGPWKAVLEEHLPGFFELCFPALFAAIDWAHPVVYLDQELQQIAPEEPRGRQHVDKLVRVRLMDGSETWILIHIEIQSQYDSSFAERMYCYNARIFDRYRQEVISLAVLGDDRPHWKPTSFGYARFGCEVRLQFLIIKLLEFDRQMLDNTDTVMAAFV
ncbi:MAG: hypothetical protein Fur005_40420 [Roseiflexaceae bacterium]